MNDIKNVIGILCQHMNYLFDVDMRPEHFRLAKFNKTDQNVVPLFWNLLYKFTKSTNSNQVHAVKVFLHSLKYRALAFYCLPDDMSHGSRELLLAFGFIIAKDNFLYQTVQLKIQASPFNPRNSILSKTEQRNAAFNKTELKDDKDKINAIKWIKGRTDILRRNVDEISSNIKIMTEKISKAVSITNVDQISMNEILALKKKEYSIHFLTQTENIITILENHEKWIKKEKLFWEWMNTVILEKNKVNEKLNYEILKQFHDSLESKQ